MMRARRQREAMNKVPTAMAAAELHASVTATKP
jgi:hypothetical protein